MHRELGMSDGAAEPQFGVPFHMVCQQQGVPGGVRVGGHKPCLLRQEGCSAARRGAQVWVRDRKGSPALTGGQLTAVCLYTCLSHCWTSHE